VAPVDAIGSSPILPGPVNGCCGSPELIAICS
jgi:hypothetical protein